MATSDKENSDSRDVSSLTQALRETRDTADEIIEFYADQTSPEFANLIANGIQLNVAQHILGGKKDD